MDRIKVVKAYYAMLDSGDINQVDQYLSEDFQLVDLIPQSMDKKAMLEMLGHFRDAFPNLAHSLSNIRTEGNLVKLTVQLAGTNSGHLDLRSMGLGVAPRSERFIIFPNEFYEFSFQDEKIVLQRNVSPPSPNRRLSGMFKAMGVEAPAY